MSEVLSECMLLIQARPCQRLSSDPGRNGKASFLAKAQGRWHSLPWNQSWKLTVCAENVYRIFLTPELEDYSPAEMLPTETKQTCLLDPTADHSPSLFICV